VAMDDLENDGRDRNSVINLNGKVKGTFNVIILYYLIL
jgi:hypothetical protein